MKNQKSFALIGAGKVGIALSYILKQHINLDLVILNSDKNIELVNRWLDSKVSYNINNIKSDIILISVKDSQIELLIESLKKNDLSKKLLINTSGTIPSDKLKIDNNFSISLHPMMSFTNDIELSIKKVESHYFTVEGDSDSIKKATSVINHITKKYHIIKKSEKPLYHIASILSNNYVHALLNIAINLVPNGDIAPFIPLLMDAIENIKSSKNPLDNVTGPVVRGDWDVVEEHINLLKNISSEDVVKIYELLANYIKNSIIIV